MHKLTFAVFPRGHEYSWSGRNLHSLQKRRWKGRQILCEGSVILRLLSSCKRYHDISNICSTFSRRTRQIYFFSRFRFARRSGRGSWLTLFRLLPWKMTCVADNFMSWWKLFSDSCKKHNISRQTCSFLEVKLRRLRRRTYDDKYDIRDKNLPTMLANSSNHSRARCHNIECK